MKKGSWILWLSIGALGCKDPAAQASDEIRRQFDSVNNSINVEDHSVEAHNEAILRSLDSMANPQPIK